MIKTLCLWFGFVFCLAGLAAATTFFNEKPAHSENQPLIEVYSKADSDIKFAKIESDMEFLAKKILELDAGCVKKGKNELVK